MMMASTLNSSATRTMVPATGPSWVISSISTPFCLASSLANFMPSMSGQRLRPTFSAVCSTSIVGVISTTLRTMRVAFSVFARSTATIVAAKAGNELSVGNRILLKGPAPVLPGSVFQLDRTARPKPFIGQGVESLNRSVTRRSSAP